MRETAKGIIFANLIEASHAADRFFHAWGINGRSLSDRHVGSRILHFEDRRKSDQDSIIARCAFADVWSQYQLEETVEWSESIREDSERFFGTLLFAMAFQGYRTPEAR